MGEENGLVHVGFFLSLFSCFPAIFDKVRRYLFVQKGLADGLAGLGHDGRFVLVRHCARVWREGEGSAWQPGCFEELGLAVTHCVGFANAIEAWR